MEIGVYTFVDTGRDPATGQQTGAAAERTRRISLTSAVTALSSDAWRSHGARNYWRRAERFAPYVDLYPDAPTRSGHDLAKMHVSINSQAHIALNSRDAANEFFPAYSEVMSRIGRERGWPPTTRAQYDAARTKRGALFVGIPQEIVDKILFQHGIFGHQRFLAQIGIGSMPHAKIMQAIELLGSHVAPAVRNAIGETQTVTN